MERGPRSFSNLFGFVGDFGCEGKMPARQPAGRRRYASTTGTTRAEVDAGRGDNYGAWI